MRAMAIDGFGGREKLKLMDLLRPDPGPGEVLVRVKAAGVNPVDWKIREGWLKALLPHEFPLIPGWDAAGVVVACGKGVNVFSRGDEVYAYCRKPVVKEGAYAEFIALPVENAAKKPRTLSFEDAASIPLAALTAYQALFDAAGLQEGEAVLIHAAAGGVGGFAVQFARDRGARVFATASAKNCDYVKDLGADHPIDYTAVDFREAVREILPDGVDVVLDAVGGDVLARSGVVVKQGGRLISIVDMPDQAALQEREIDARFVFVAPNRGQLEKLAGMVEEGRLKTHVCEILPLEQAARAHEMIESRHTSGKIVLRI